MASPEQPRPVPEELVRRVRVAGGLLAAGLVIQGTTLFSSSPTAFLTFALAGASLVAAGVAVYLYAAVSR